MFSDTTSYIYFQNIKTAIGHLSHSDDLMLLVVVSNHVTFINCLQFYILNLSKTTEPIVVLSMHVLFLYQLKLKIPSDREPNGDSSFSINCSYHSNLQSMEKWRFFLCNLQVDNNDYLCIFNIFLNIID